MGVKQTNRGQIRFISLTLPGNSSCYNLEVKKTYKKMKLVKFS